MEEKELKDWFINNAITVSDLSGTAFLAVKFATLKELVDLSFHQGQIAILKKLKRQSGAMIKKGSMMIIASDCYHVPVKLIKALQEKLKKGGK